jgi:hypothetical protein
MHSGRTDWNPPHLTVQLIVDTASDAYHAMECG